MKVLVAILALALASPALAQGGPGKSVPKYNPAAESVFKGTIDANENGSGDFLRFDQLTGCHIEVTDMKRGNAIRKIENRIVGFQLRSIVIS
jgi:hypothetical protein